jgi:thiazolinyl imide reductase
MNPLNVLVCGTNYGRTYIEAINLGGASYRLAGILARGSARSKQVAHQYGVPLYLCIEGLTRDIELACAAMGGSGGDVVAGLLARGIHVLSEHPQKSSQLQSALSAAASRHLCFHVNGHFADLGPGAFISHCSRESGIARPSFFHVTATDRSLYAALDILRRVVPSFAPFQFQAISRVPPFTIVQGLLNGVPATFHLQINAEGIPLPDGSPAYLIDHRIVAGFPSGILTLLSMNGPVVWNANPNYVARPAQPLFTVARSALSPPIFYQKRVAGNLAAMSAVVRNINERVTPPQQEPDYLLDVSRAWDAIGSLL